MEGRLQHTKLIDCKRRSIPTVVPASVQKMVSNLKSNQKHLNNLSTRKTNTRKIQSKTRDISNRRRTSAKQTDQSLVKTNHLTGNNTKNVESKVKNMHENDDAKLDSIVLNEFQTNATNNVMKAEVKIKDEQNEGNTQQKAHYNINQKVQSKKKKDTNNYNNRYQNQSSRISCLYDWDDNTTYDNIPTYQQYRKNLRNIDDKENKTNMIKPDCSNYAFNNSKNASVRDECEQKIRKQIEYRTQLKHQIDEETKNKLQYERRSQGSTLVRKK